jgi:CRP/FNR family cyclic AMP-dependent transcriptional regulator
MTASLADHLARVGLFGELTRGELAELATCVRTRRYPKGRIIFGEGDPGSHLYLIADGRVSVGTNSPDGRFLELHSFGPGEVFGELALLDGEPRSADAVALEPCELLLLSRTDFLRFLNTHPKVAIRLLAVLSRHLRRTNQQAAQIAFLPVSVRLAQVLLNLAESQGSSPGGGDPRTFRVTQAELATQIGATRESVNRGLSDFEEQGLIRCQRGQVTVLRSAGLREQIA